MSLHVGQFINNKYTRWYYAIIDHRVQNLVNGYVERHHIVPRSMGGSNERSNIVQLTAREHFVCHLLLTRMTTGINKARMVTAVCFLADVNRGGIWITALTYEKLQKAHAEAASKLTKLQWKNDLERKRAQSVRMKCANPAHTHPDTLETRERKRQGQLRRYTNTNERKLTAEKTIASCKRPEVFMKRSQAQKARRMRDRAKKGLS